MQTRFFISCQIGLEDLLEQELLEVFPWLLDLDFRPQTSGFEVVEKIKGGIEIETEFHFGLQLNYYLKVASRILLRLSSTERVQEFFQLEKALKNLNLKKYLGAKAVSLQVDCSQSRLGQEKKVQATVEKSLNPIGVKFSSDASQKLFIRIHKDQLTVSLDTTGEHLHFRGYRRHQGIAPLRESLAAAALMLLRGTRSLGSLNDVELFDPFCGSGTFLFEAATLFQPNFQRSFSFEGWDSLPVLLQKYPRKERGLPGWPLQLFLGGDRDPEMIDVAQRNAHPLFPQVKFTVGDFFGAQGASQVRRQLWIVSNPPYHERLKADFTMEEFVKKLQTLRPTRLALVLSEKQAAAFHRLWPGFRELSTDNGGIAVKIIFSSEDLRW
ncbi:MAG: hypothetical protein ACK5RO_07485 [Pseudobdellovibrionaceae bacterium]